MNIWIDCVELDQYTGEVLVWSSVGWTFESRAAVDQSLGSAASSFIPTFRWNKTNLCFIKTSKNWLLDWAANLIQVQLPRAGAEASVRHYLFVVKVAICSFKIEDETSLNEDETSLNEANSENDQPSTPTKVTCIPGPKNWKVYRNIYFMKKSGKKP